MIVHERTQAINREQIAAVYLQMMKNGDRANAVKMLDIYEKHKNQELIISFAGHFSAGKSSMINTLLGKEILPKSPIPTSANVVKISSGEGVARVYFTNELPAEYKEPYDIDMIKEYSKDKEAIKKIEISTLDRVVPDGAAIIDTPGIDAADDADRIMTEASLHLADVLLYIMDYNHVQSEVNLQFLKSIQDKGLPYYVVINQIDKHDERELSFTDFDRNIKQTFDQWSLNPEYIYYTSLIDDSAEHNQIEQIKQKLFSMMENRHQHLQIAQSVRRVMDEHRAHIKTTYEAIANERTGNSNHAAFSGLDDLKEIQDQINHLENEPAQFEKDYMHELQRTLQNAYIMPAGLREKAELYLESQQPDFKVGIFASKRKTLEEQERRLRDFLSALEDNVNSTIQWKLRDKFTGLLKKYRIEDAVLQNRINELRVHLGKDLVESLIKPGAKVNGDYVLHYTNDVSSDIKSKFKQESRKILTSIHALIAEKNKPKKLEYLQNLHELNDVKALQEDLDRIKAEEKKAIDLLESQLADSEIDDALLEQIDEELNSRQKPVRQDMNAHKNRLRSDPKEQSPSINENAGSGKSSPISSVLSSIEKTIYAIQGLPGFDSFVNDLKDKENRLRNRSYTIALFGAFSAGKSSFANALMGEKVLPVSPNPTTATVNRICPVTEQNLHGSVSVKLKDRQALINDLYMITKKFSPPAEEFEKLMEWVQTNQLQKSDQLNKMYQSYLQAMINGYKEMQQNIGKSITITIEDFESFVTDESKACYMESINLYYDCEITRQGITLVDTPGADSVNARHTNVAFDYIKHADAILYVTYYNHALSRADKDFLMQLGRVKEAFQLDKMFFIVNAADLAADEEELKLVTDYVKEQLQLLGIRLPRLYPVSSKASLDDKVQKKPINDQMHHLENDFYQFINEDLAALTVQSAISDMNRSRHAVVNYMNTLRMDNNQKEKRKRELHTKKEKLNGDIRDLSTKAYQEQINQKIDKQLFYVVERLSIRYHDMFKEMFNPTTINESGRKALPQLRNGLENLIEYIGFELHQELLAVSLRVEAYIQLQINEVLKSLAERCIQADPLFELPDMGASELETPEYEQGLTTIDLAAFDRIIAKFKGTKAFFEKNEKEFMKEEMYAIIEPYVKQYVETNRQYMGSAYRQQWEDLVADRKAQAEQNIGLQLNNYLQMLISAADIGELQKKQELLDSILKEHDIEEVS
ncbi:dynamin family protein [Oceanobacillus massiliensis]|uniref:dynamin family protein n=1 Tax=Oceanobacillus massiliensis TaxID=1465765 RepID=UPI0002D7EDCA|nr:dynamin family protein [Oceanobacillus massiliensis]